MVGEEKLFAEIRLQGKPLPECELVYQDKNDNLRLYVVRGEDSFWAHAVEFVSAPADGGENLWEREGLIVSTVFEVTAYFDGVRHLEFNRNGGDMDGYLYYPSMVGLIAMLQKVRDLELEICRDVEK